MDKYKEIFEKGNSNFIEELNEIKWFENPYIEEDEMKRNIMECSFLPFLATKLVQTRYTVDFWGTDQIEHILENLKKVLNNLKFQVYEDSILLELNNYSKTIEIDIDEFEAGEGEDSFVSTVINQFLSEAGLDYQFYEMPPDDETSSQIFVTPEKYNKAIEKGIIPDFMGYYAVNY